MECRKCGSDRENSIHKDAGECDPCNRPWEHHAFVSPLNLDLNYPDAVRAYQWLRAMKHNRFAVITSVAMSDAISAALREHDGDGWPGVTITNLTQTENDIIRAALLLSQ